MKIKIIYHYVHTAIHCQAADELKKPCIQNVPERKCERLRKTMGAVKT